MAKKTATSSKPMVSLPGKLPPQPPAKKPASSETHRPSPKMIVAAILGFCHLFSLLFNYLKKLLKWPSSNPAPATAPPAPTAPPKAMSMPRLKPACKPKAPAWH